MCGISGISGNLVNEEKFIFLSKSFLKRRGPNNFSIKKINNPSSLICHSRLSIIDLNERSNQPIKSRCGNYLLTYNGELYNFREIKRELINKGISFYTESDINVEGDIFEYLPQNCLVKTDRASMHFGLEVRSPFLQPKMESCAKKISIKNKYLICKQKMFHRKMYRELSGSDYYLKKKKGFSFDRSFLEQEFKEKFNRSINISKKFLLNNGYDHKIIRRISENNLVKWRFFSLGLYLETLNLDID